MNDIFTWVRAAVESGWPFVFTLILVALALYVRAVIDERIRDLKDRIAWLEANCLGEDGAVG